ncbi:MAG: SurA N-terminal domain-containing protein [Deltaproteobacteria bacterium]|nr:SurA N-terminal domain-containing protein [Deltaproteobacteria bacterium]
MPRPSASLHNLCLLVGLSLGMLACEQPIPSTPPSPSGVARVNGEDISKATFIEALNELKEAGKGFFSSAETANRVKRDLLERLIEGELLLQEARRKGIHIDPKLVEAKIRLLACS